MASGVTVDDDCKTCYENLKLRKDHRYIIYKMSDDNKRIIIEKEGNRGILYEYQNPRQDGVFEESYEDFIEMLKSAETKKEGRYAVYDCEYDKKNPNKSKLVFIMWIPEGIPIRQKMLYTSSKKALIPKLQGLGKEMQCNDDDDLAWSNMVEKCQSKYD